MKKSKAVLCFLIVFFFAGSLTASFNEWLKPITTVEITNAGSEFIKYINISTSGIAEQQAQIA